VSGIKLKHVPPLKFIPSEPQATGMSVVRNTLHVFLGISFIFNQFGSDHLCLLCFLPRILLYGGVLGVATGFKGETDTLEQSRLAYGTHCCTASLLSLCLFAD
jgi:disulfide bond formation protein DsbB